MTRELPLTKTIICTAFLVATPLAADSQFICRGSSPDWVLELNAEDAQLDFQRKGQFQIPDMTVAEGHDWPRAYTLIADFDTAIVLIDRASCTQGDQSHPYSAQILTQRGQTPILLTGCCEARR